MPSSSRFGEVMASFSRKSGRIRSRGSRRLAFRAGTRAAATAPIVPNPAYQSACCHVRESDSTENRAWYTTPIEFATRDSKTCASA